MMSESDKKPIKDVSRRLMGSRRSSNELRSRNRKRRRSQSRKSTRRSRSSCSSSPCRDQRYSRNSNRRRRENSSRGRSRSSSCSSGRDRSHVRRRRRRLIDTRYRRRKSPEIRHDRCHETFSRTVCPLWAHLPPPWMRWVPNPCSVAFSTTHPPPRPIPSTGYSFPPYPQLQCPGLQPHFLHPSEAALYKAKPRRSRGTNRHEDRLIRE